jgi:hypothetical protein
MGIVYGEGRTRVTITSCAYCAMAKAQAVDRVHRIGQARDVLITRYCVTGSIEEASIFPTSPRYLH